MSLSDPERPVWVIERDGAPSRPRVPRAIRMAVLGLWATAGALFALITTCDTYRPPTGGAHHWRYDETCSGRWGGAGTFLFGLGCVVVALALWHAPSRELRWMRNGSATSVAVQRALLPGSICFAALGLVLGMSTFLDGSVPAWASVAFAAAMALAAASAAATFTAARLGRPRAFVPPSLRQERGR